MDLTILPSYEFNGVTYAPGQSFVHIISKDGSMSFPQSDSPKLSAYMQASSNQLSALLTVQGLVSGLGYVYVCYRFDNEFIKHRRYSLYGAEFPLNVPTLRFLDIDVFTSLYSPLTSTT